MNMNIYVWSHQDRATVIQIAVAAQDADQAREIAWDSRELWMVSTFQEKQLRAILDTPPTEVNIPSSGKVIEELSFWWED